MSIETLFFYSLLGGIRGRICSMSPLSNLDRWVEHSNILTDKVTRGNSSQYNIGNKFLFLTKIRKPNYSWKDCTSVFSRGGWSIKWKKFFWTEAIKWQAQGEEITIPLTSPHLVTKARYHFSLSQNGCKRVVIASGMRFPSPTIVITSMCYF